jgi:hypothetical protein
LEKNGAVNTRTAPPNMAADGFARRMAVPKSENSAFPTCHLWRQAIIRAIHFALNGRKNEYAVEGNSLIISSTGLKELRCVFPDNSSPGLNLT